MQLTKEQQAKLNQQGKQKPTQTATQPKATSAIAKPESQLFALVEADSAAAKADMGRLAQYGQARTKAVTGAFEQVIDQSNQDIAQFIADRYQNDTDFFDPSAYLDFTPMIGQTCLPGSAIDIAALPAVS
jgi:hypothetical protein